MIAKNDLQDLSLEANNIAREAGKILRKYFLSSYDITIKEDKSPVTTADLAANEIIENRLSKLTPNIPRISEESNSLDYQNRRQWESFWLIDPLDGTREFIKNSPDFTVNIALIHLHQPILGTIYLPMSDHLYFATKQNNAFREVGRNTSELITVSKQLTDMPRVCGSRAHPGKSMQKFLGNLGKHELISRGSSIKSCLIADGSADIYPRFGPTWEWDTAAAQCIVEEAGGHLTNMEFKALSYNKESLLNPPFIAYASNRSKWKSLI